MVFEVFATSIFIVAICHVFFSNYFSKKAHRLQGQKKSSTFAISGYSFLGNPAMIFGFWLIPVLLVMAIAKGGGATYEVLKSVDLIEPFAYFVLVAVATVHPLHNFFRSLMEKMSRLFQNRLLFFWFGMILVSSLLTGVFSAIGIMTLVCAQLAVSFFHLKPSIKLVYCTFALLLLGISMGTTILPINFSFFQTVVNGNWSHWDTFYLFGWKVLVALLIVTSAVGYSFRKEFKKLQKKFVKPTKKIKIRFREILYALLFLIASIGKENVYVLLMVLAFIIILHKSFYRIKGEEGKLQLYFPIIVAFFTYTLEIHTSFQKWWVLPLFERAEGMTSYFYAFFLTGANEHVPMVALRETLQTASSNTQFFSFLGVLAGGGLTIIAKSANIVAKFKLRNHFPHHTISPMRHLLTAIPFGLILSAIVTLLHYLGGR